MTLHFLRRTLISLSRKNEPSNFINPSITPLSSFFSSLVTPTEESTSKIKDYFITHHNFSSETALKTSVFLTDFTDCRRSKLVLNYFKKKGFSDTQLEELVLCDPAVLSVDYTKTIKGRVKKILDLGFTNIELANLLCTVSGVLTLPRTNRFIAKSISVLQTVLLSNSEVIRLLRICNWFLCSDLESNLLPNIEMMTNARVSMLQIRRLIFSFPRFFLIKPEVMRDCMRRTDEMGLTSDSKMYIYGLRVLSSMSSEKWDSKLKLFQSLGFSENDILYVFRKTPPVLAISERKMLEVSKVLLSFEGVDISYLITHAELFVYSAATRLKPRLEIVNTLLSKSLIPRPPTLLVVCKVPDEEFIQRFVFPYANEIGEVGKKFIVSKGFCKKYNVSKGFEAHNLKL